MSAATRWGLIGKYTRGNVTSGGGNTVEIWLPERLDFEQNYEATACHFKMVRFASYNRFGIKNLHFDNITSISPSAALVLASEVDRWNQRVGGKLRAHVETWDDEIKRLLCEMGYFELLGLQKPATEGKGGDVTFLQFLKGESGQSNIGQLAKQLRVQIENIVGKEIKKHFLFEGLSEAITNVGQHAYPPSILDGRPKQWWLSASFNKRDRQLNVMFYDQGVGIPNTLPTSHLFEHIKGFFHLWDDSQKIEAAMEYGRSATQRPERGKGLKNLLEFAKAHEAGRLSIYSRCGLYRLAHNSDDRIETARRQHETSVGGTLIEWSVRL
jgi:hypothetical protein